MNFRLTSALAIVLLSAPQAYAQMPDRAPTDALNAVSRLRNYTAFDWITAEFAKGVLTLRGLARSPQLKREAEDTARKTRGIEEVTNLIEVLPAIASDDDVRIRAYSAIYGNPGLERYAPGGQMSDNTRRELDDAKRIGLDGADVGRGYHPIHIIVSSGRVLLLGMVNSTGDKRTAEVALRTLPGVLDVTSQLRVAK
ncbi:MAG TPA: BON domain-containing protein [Vicinamibacterales bacterium]|nr:BON domain-containing protein [Vicinamibacterales bacterium]